MNTTSAFKVICRHEESSKKFEVLTYMFLEELTLCFISAFIL